jgi:protein gp37
MSDNSKIEWCDATLNVFRGCSKVSAGCKHCYAEAMAARFHKPGQWGHGLTDGRHWTGDVNFVPEAMTKPFRWHKPRRIFINSTSDTFHKNVEDEWLDYLIATIALNPHHTFMVLTKRPERMHKYMHNLTEKITTSKDTLVFLKSRFADAMRLVSRYVGAEYPNNAPLAFETWPPPNLWLGVSIEDQATAEQRITPLLATPAAVRFVSAEPLLAPVDLTRLDMDVMFGINDPDPHGYRPKHYFDALRGMSDINPIHGAEPDLGKLDWLIVGGESGPNARPTHPDWVCSLRDQCAVTDTPFFFKQWGSWQCVYDRDQDDPDWQNCPRAKDNSERYVNLEGGHGFHGDRVVFMKRTSKKNASNTLDGQTHLAFPNMESRT